MSKVLVTGGSGFIGSHCILELLKAGHQVHTTVRNLKREPELRALLGVGDTNDLTFFAADLEADAGWSSAVAGCDYILHVASPFPASVPKDENELIIPAREGALRVLRAARDAGVKRVVLTSSFAAIGYGHPPQTAPFTEESWTDLSGTIPVAPYQKSKTLAERAAWDFIASEGNGLELSVVNPVGVFGPVFGPDYATSILIVERLLKGNIPGCPNLAFGIVDVRDVVSLHLLAMTHPAAAGERFLAVAGDNMSFLEIAKLLKTSLGTAAKRVPLRSIPDWVLRVFALVDRQARGVLPELGNSKSCSHEKASHVLGWSPRSKEEAILATAESLIRLGLVGNK
ncbi:SDR family oxidoreductase [Granulicella paludicola]|uniref:SDR family oxidoreductase n=1 Tax=Granulicella paludicola TaxID=474951 RepID=UPI0021DF7A79|nr:aldehyde reductase [Granulicella paludicola]